MTSQELKNLLAHYYGSENMYCHAINRNTAYTEGVRAFAVHAGAYWFLDIVATELFALQRDEGFLSIVLDVKGDKATISVGDGNGKALYTKLIDWTDCPEGEWKFFFTGDVLMLPSEY